MGKKFYSNYKEMPITIQRVIKNRFNAVNFILMIFSYTGLISISEINMLNLEQQAKAQAIYMQHLLEKAQERAQTRAQTNALAFDPQGRVLVDVTLDGNDWITIAQKVNATLNTELSDVNLQKELRRTTDTTTVSLDITGHPDLKEKFKHTLEEALTRIGVLPNRTSRIVDTLDKEPKGSIIALQQEFHFHLGLAARVYQKTNKKFKGKEKEMQAAHEAAVNEVNKLVLEAYAKALEKAVNSKGELNVKQLNQALDKARKSITPQAHTILRREIVRHTGVILTKLNKSELKHTAEATTATANDVLHTDNHQHLATLIKGSENTAHHRVQGREFAHRQLITHPLTKDGIIPHSHPRIQIRTPSPVVKEGLSEEEYISDVAIKLDEITHEYSLKEKLSSHEGMPKAFIYNRYTAINDSLGDINGNLQTQSARHILKGAHEYNAKQLAEGNAVYCLVQNISVNGFGDHLGYSGDDLTIESTLMTEMALLHTLYSTSAEQQENIKKVFEKYNHFLRHRKGGDYFSQSNEGKEAIKAIEAIKKGWQKEEPHEAAPDLFSDVQSSLKKLIANNLHFSHDYAKLIQSLSVFIEEASISGCKSGNERAQAINGRVAILDAVQHTPPENLSNEGKAIYEALIKLSKTETASDVIRAADELKLAIDTAYNQLGLQTAASIVSLIDQGGPAKIEAKPGHPFYASRNYGEEKARVLPNLQQTKAGSMQAHKDLPSQMVDAWEGHPVSWWSRMKSSPLGVIGAIIGTIIFPIAAIVAVVNPYKNTQAKAEVTQENKILEQEFQQFESNRIKHEVGGGTDGKIFKLGIKPNDSSTKTDTSIYTVSKEKQLDLEQKSIPSIEDSSTSTQKGLTEISSGFIDEGNKDPVVDTKASNTFQ